MPLHVIVDGNGTVHRVISRDRLCAQNTPSQNTPSPCDPKSFHPRGRAGRDTLLAGGVADIGRADVVIVQNGTSANRTLASATVASKAMVGAIVWLAQSPLQRVWLHDETMPGGGDRICSKTEAVRVLSDLIERQVQRPDFQLWKLPLERSLFADKWQIARDIVTGRMTARTRSMLLDRLFRGSYTLMRRPSTREHYVPHDIGAQLLAYKSYIGDVRIGRRFNTLEARSYGQWLDAGFAAVRPHGPQC